MDRPIIAWAAACVVALGGPAMAQSAPQAKSPLDSAGAAEAQRSAAMPATPGLSTGEALIMLDYQQLAVPGAADLDLMGFHILNRMTPWLHLGVGGYAPLFEGEYGGFMAFDVTAHAQRKLWGHWFAQAGLSMGGGGGGKSIQQSKVLSGTGGFTKASLGLGYEFEDFSVGANLAHMRFKRSAIDSTQLNLFVQVPFTYTIGSYASGGSRLFADDAGSLFDGASENTLTLGLDNYFQIDPKGSNKGTIRAADLQFAHYVRPDTYWYASLGVGYQGLPLYNQLIGGIGQRFKLAPQVHLHAQVGVGSGGYAPETIETGPGLLVYPKLSAEYLLSRHFGLALSAGYLAAPRGTSRNYTLGLALNYRIQTGERPDAEQLAAGLPARGHRFHLFQQSQLNVRYKDTRRDDLNLLTVQFDSTVSDHLYIPVQAGVAYNAYLGYPGYGELLAGLGVQSRHAPGRRFQAFAQALAGTNVHGPIVKAGLGLNVGLSDRTALFATAGQTLAPRASDGKFTANYVGLGVTHRFSVPSW